MTQKNQQSFLSFASYVRSSVKGIEYLLHRVVQLVLMEKCQLFGDALKTSEQQQGLRWINEHK